jgi:hypothetical protein
MELAGCWMGMTSAGFVDASCGIDTSGAGAAGNNSRARCFSSWDKYNGLGLVDLRDEFDESS